MFKSAFKVELKKLINRKEVWLLLTMPLVSLLYSVGLATNSSIVSYSGNGNIDALTFVSNMVSMASSMFIFYILVAIIATRSFASEIEDKSILLYIPRLRNRNSLYLAKSFALTVVYMFAFICFIIVSVILYFIFCVQIQDIANGLWYQVSSLLPNVMNILAIYICFVYSSQLVLFLCNYFKTMISIGIFMVIFVLLNLISQFDYIKVISPFYYVDKFSSGVTDINILMIFIMFILANTASILIFTILGMMQFKNKDL